MTLKTLYLLDLLNFIPHGHCYLWKPFLVWLHVLSDGLTVLAYYSIPISLIYLIKKRQDIPFSWIFFWFGAFIICCGTTHLFNIITIWYPVYWLSGFIKAITAMVSVTSALLLVPLLPKLLALPSPAQLEAANYSLSQEVKERKKAEQKANESIKKLKIASVLLANKNKEINSTLKDLKFMQARLIHSEKMSSLGQLMAGVAHEINNPVGFIYTNIYHLSEYLDPIVNLLNQYRSQYLKNDTDLQKQERESEIEFILVDIYKVIESMQSGANRIKKIVEMLRNFSRLDESGLKNVDLHEGIDSSLNLLNYRLQSRINGTQIKVFREYRDLPLVFCYPGPINQVFMHLLMNAIDALESAHRPPGETSKERNIWIHTELTESNRVKICITDNGEGIPPDRLSKIFDPFFTSKPIGTGTGLGLSISYQVIVEQHGGQLQCTSEVGKGTTFSIELPLQPQKKALAAGQITTSLLPAL